MRMSLFLARGYRRDILIKEIMHQEPHFTDADLTYQDSNEEFIDITEQIWRFFCDIEKFANFKAPL